MQTQIQEPATWAAVTQGAKEKHAVSVGPRRHYNSLKIIKWDITVLNTLQVINYRWEKQVQAVWDHLRHTDFPLQFPPPLRWKGLCVCFQRASTDNPKTTKTQHLLHVASYYSQIVNTTQRREKKSKQRLLHYWHTETYFKRQADRWPGLQLAAAIPSATQETTGTRARAHGFPLLTSGS